jgi:hypothetical protein
MGNFSATRGPAPRELASKAARANDVRGIGVMMTLNRNIARDLDTLAQRHEMAASSIQTNR